MVCESCPCKTPFMADPERIQHAQERQFEPALDEGIRDAVLLFVSHGIETCESCEGGPGHSYPEPTIRFEGDLSEGPRAVAVAVAYGLPVKRLRRVWAITQGMMHGPWWEMTFLPMRPGLIASLSPLPV